MAKDLSYYLNKTKAGAETAPAAKTKKTSTAGSGGLSYYLAKNRNTPSYASALGNTQGLYAQALQDNRDAGFGEKLRNITGGTLGGMAKTYAADMGNAYATLGQTLGALAERNPLA